MPEVPDSFLGGNMHFFHLFKLKKKFEEKIEEISVSKNGIDRLRKRNMLR